LGSIDSGVIPVEKYNEELVEKLFERELEDEKISFDF